MYRLPTSRDLQESVTHRQARTQPMQQARLGNPGDAFNWGTSPDPRQDHFGGMDFGSQLIQARDQRNMSTPDFSPGGGVYPERRKLPQVPTMSKPQDAGFAGISNMVSMGKGLQGLQGLTGGSGLEGLTSAFAPEIGSFGAAGVAGGGYGGGGALLGESGAASMFGSGAAAGGVEFGAGTSLTAGAGFGGAEALAGGAAVGAGESSLLATAGPYAAAVVGVDMLGQAFGWWDSPFFGLM